jgi:hypothetical protein
MERGCEGRQLFNSLLVLLLTVWRTTEGGYVAQYGLDYRTSIGDTSYRYPDGSAEDRSYFISQLNFDLLEGAVVTGAADRLVFLSTSDLSLLSEYQWRDEDNEENCRNIFDSSSAEVWSHDSHVTLSAGHTCLS